MSTENDGTFLPNDAQEPVISTSPSNTGSQGSNSSSSGMGSFVDAGEDFGQNAAPDGPPSDNSASSLVMVDVRDDSTAEEALNGSNSGENDESGSSGLLQENDASSLVVDDQKEEAVEEKSPEAEAVDNSAPPSDSSSSSLVVVDAEEDVTTAEPPSEVKEEPVSTENADVVTTDDLVGGFLSGGLIEKEDDFIIEDVTKDTEQNVDQSEAANLKVTLEGGEDDALVSPEVSKNTIVAEEPIIDGEEGTGASPSVSEQKSDHLTGDVNANQSIENSNTDLLNVDAGKTDSDDGVLIYMSDVTTEKANISSILPSSDPSMLQKARAKPVMPEIAYSRPETTTTEDSEHDPLTVNLSNDVSHFTSASQMTTASQTTRHHSNSKRNLMHNTGGTRFPEPIGFSGDAMASVNEKVSTEVNNSTSTTYDEWAARQGCAPPPPPQVIDDFEMVNMDKEMRSQCQPQVVKTTGSGGSNGSASSAAPTETFEKVAPVKALNGFFVDMGRLIVVGVLSIVGGVVASLFANDTCDFATISKPVGYYGEVLNVHVGMTQFTSMDSVFQGQAFCIDYSHDYYSTSPPVFARACGTFALVMGALASVTVWHYIFTTKAVAPLWNAGIFFATSAALSQALTFQFFFSTVCENEACGLGAGSLASLVATVVYAYSAFEMRRNSPVRGIGMVNEESLLSDYKAPELV